MDYDQILAEQREINKTNQQLLQALAADKVSNHGWDGKSTMYHTKDVASSQTATPLHGIGGIFSTPGLDREVITAHVRPRGIASAIPAYPSIDERPFYSIITGFGPADGEEPDDACEDAPSGYMKSCVLTSQFGLTRRDTKTIDFDKTMVRVNRGDFTDLRLVGRVLGLSGLEPRSLNQSQILSLITMSEMVGAAVQAERKLTRDFWTGTVANAAHTNGLDVQINTGIVDAQTGAPCPAVDSDIKDFTYNNVDGSDGKNIVEYITMLEYFIFHNADRMGLTPFTGAFSMRPELWAELSAVWPCQYNTNRCATATMGNSQVIIDGRENQAEINNMRRSMTIQVNGRTYPVIIDDGIVEEDGSAEALQPGEYASSIYFVPLTVNGGFEVLYREYLNYNSGLANANVDLLRGRNSFWTDGGMYAWAYEENKFCYKLALKTEQRIILRTPQLAGRIQNVKYTPLQHLRSPFPESAYFKNGGSSFRDF